MMLSNSCSVSSITVLVIPRPALFTQTSMRPCFFRAESRRFSRSLLRVTSVTTGVAFDPVSAATCFSSLSRLAGNNELMTLRGKLSSQRSTDSATRSSDHNNLSWFQIKKNQFRLVLGRNGFSLLVATLRISIVVLGSLQLLEVSQSHFVQDPNYRTASSSGT